MKTLTKAIAGTAAAGALALSAASPAVARDRGGIDAGDVVAGALVIGGIAAVAAAANSDSNRYGYERAGYDRDYGRYGYDNGYGYGRDNSRQAVAQCTRVAEQEARRAGYDRSNVTDIRSVRETRRGYEVKGRIAVRERGGWNDRWDNDRWDRRDRGVYKDGGQFTCRIDRGRVVDLDYFGIRGL